MHMNRKLIAVPAALTLALISARAVSAQTPLQRAVSREAARLALEQTASDPIQPRASRLSDWRRVEQLQPSTDVTIATRTQPARKLTVLHSDDAGVTVVNLAGVPYHAKENVLTAARQLPADAAALGRNIVSGPVVMAADAVFIDGRRIGSPADIIETMPRAEIMRITRERVNVANKALASAAGAVGGFFAGAYIGAAVEPSCRCDDPGLKGIIIGAPIGAVLGGIAGAKAIRSHEETIYEAAP